MEKFKTVLAIGGILLILTFGGIALKAIFFTPTVINKSIDMAYEVTKDTLDGDKAIREYEWFKRQAQSMQALEKKESRAIGELASFKEMMGDDKRSDWDREDKAEYDRLNANKIAVQNTLDDALGEYNARGDMTNRAIFKDNLPSNLTRAILTGSKFTK